MSPTDAMTTATGIGATPPRVEGSSAWRELRADSDIQFAPVTIPDAPPPEPGWLEQVLRWLAEQFNLGQFFAGSWPVLRWVLLALLVVAVLFIIYRLVEPLLQARGRDGMAEDTGWVPATSDTLALLEDADRLAAEGRFDEATHLLLRRSVGQIAAARPDWVEPSSTARELAALSALPDAARSAFGLIAERVERSLFALRALDRNDWETARAAYADFALTNLPERRTVESGG